MGLRNNLMATSQMETYPVFSEKQTILNKVIIRQQIKWEGCVSLKSSFIFNYSIDGKLNAFSSHYCEDIYECPFNGNPPCCVFYFCIISVCISKNLYFPRPTWVLPLNSSVKRLTMTHERNILIYLMGFKWFLRTVEPHYR